MLQLLTDCTKEKRRGSPKRCMCSHSILALQVDVSSQKVGTVPHKKRRCVACQWFSLPFPLENDTSDVLGKLFWCKYLSASLFPVCVGRGTSWGVRHLCVKREKGWRRRKESAVFFCRGNSSKPGSGMAEWRESVQKKLEENCILRDCTGCEPELELVHPLVCVASHSGFIKTQLKILSIWLIIIKAASLSPCLITERCTSGSVSLKAVEMARCKPTPITLGDFSVPTPFFLLRFSLLACPEA